MSFPVVFIIIRQLPRQFDWNWEGIVLCFIVIRLKTLLFVIVLSRYYLLSEPALGIACSCAFIALIIDFL